MKKAKNKIKLYLLELKHADIMLILIMILLLIQMLINQIAVSDEIAYEEIDIVVRTTAAAIFGYFLSANFTSRCKQTEISDLEKRITLLKTMEEDESLEERNAEIELLQKQMKNKECNEVQNIIVGIIGIASLLFLLLIKNFLPIHDNMSPGIAQLRDFVSGSIGFLIGTPAEKK